MDGYRPLKLPSILHDFPQKHYKYIPKFSGELDKISTDKHMEGFDHFTDLFEVEHDDVFMIEFSQSLQWCVEEWFRHLYA